MSNWVRVNGIVKHGHGVASGRSGDPRFPNGTIAMQKPIFKERGLDLERYFPGTINVSIDPCKYAIVRAKYTFRDIRWTSAAPSEDFSFFDCRLFLNNGINLAGLIYYPHPDTKSAHFQAPDILEIMTEFIQGLEYGDKLIVEMDRMQIDISCINTALDRQVKD
jgi:hypothetical protein